MSASRDARRNADRIVGGRLDRLGRAVGFELGGRLMRKTPVDKGRARANWNASVDRPDYSTRESTTPVPPTAVQGFRLGQGQTLYWSNGLPYIERLENGSSRQAPNGMARLSVMEMRPFVERVAGGLNRG